VIDNLDFTIRARELELLHGQLLASTVIVNITVCVSNPLYPRRPLFVEGNDTDVLMVNNLKKQNLQLVSGVGGMIYDSHFVSLWQ
jgi:hypothetical protein